MSLIIAIDIGGTHIRAAAYEPDSTKPVAHTKTKSLAKTPGVFDRLVKTVEAVWQEGRVSAIGIASPGPLNPHTGTILDTPNIPQWTNFPVASKLSERFGVPVFLDNDANLAGLAEWQFGAGRGHSDLVYLTISTGIGGGVIMQDRLLLGWRGLAGELGHVTIQPEGPVCSCGKRGHIEAFSSGRGIAHYVEEQLASGRASSLKGSPSAREISAAAQSGDLLAVEAYERAANYLGIMVANYLHIFNPSILVMGGGVSQSSALFMNPFRAALEKHIIAREFIEGLQIVPAALGDDCGLLGALAMAREYQA